MWTCGFTNWCEGWDVKLSKRRLLTASYISGYLGHVVIITFLQELFFVSHLPFSPFVVHSTSVGRKRRRLGDTGLNSSFLIPVLYIVDGVWTRSLRVNHFFPCVSTSSCWDSPFATSSRDTVRERAGTNGRLMKETVGWHLEDLFWMVVLVTTVMTLKSGFKRRDMISTSRWSWLLWWGSTLMGMRRCPGIWWFLQQGTPPPPHIVSVFMF